MEPPQRISHESIYTALYAMPKGELRALRSSPCCASVIKAADPVQRARTGAD